MAGTTDLGAFTQNSNPSTTCGGTTAAATSAGDKVVLTLFIPNSNPTFAAHAVQIDGHDMTEVPSARETRSNKTICTFWFDDTTGRASGKTITATWTNAGTQNGGGSVGIACTITPTHAFVAGAPDVVGSNQGVSTGPTTGSSGTPSDATADYYAYVALGVIFNVIGQETPAGSYVALTQAAITARNLLLDGATLEFTSPPVAAQNESWTQASGGGSAWVSQILMFKESVPGAPVNTVAPVESGTETVGSTLSTTNGTWTNSPTGFTYQWERDVGTAGVTWLNIAGATASTYVLTNSDIGSKVRCAVVASNVGGNSAAAPSNTTSVTIPAPASMTYRVVAGPVGQSDNQVHSTPLLLPVLPGELMVLVAGCSNANLIDGNGNQSDVGTVTDDGSNTWTQDAEAFSDTNIQHSCQVFSAPCPSGLAYGKNVTMTVHGGTGAGGYHGQSPLYFVMALNTGTGAAFVFDAENHQVDLLTTHTAPSITTAAACLVFGMHAGGIQAGGGWWTPTAGFTVVEDTPAANSGGSFTGETQYNVAAEAKIVTSGGYTGGAGGTTAANFNLTNIVISYKPASTAPTNTVAPAVTGTPTQGGVLSCSTGTWTGSPTFGYQWTRAGTNISGATASTYTLVSGDGGHAILCVVTATNGGGSTSANSNSVSAGFAYSDTLASGKLDTLGNPMAEIYGRAYTDTLTSGVVVLLGNRMVETYSIPAHYTETLPNGKVVVTSLPMAEIFPTVGDQHNRRRPLTGIS